MQEIFDVKLLESKGLVYRNGTVRTLNSTGYMRNYLCDISREFCSQPFLPSHKILEVGFGIGTVLHTLIRNGAKHIVGIDREIQHVNLVKYLLQEIVTEHKKVDIDIHQDVVPELGTLENLTFDSILCAQILHYLNPVDFEAAIKRLWSLLKSGGRLYLTIGSPHLESYPGFSEEYAIRLARGERYPGYMTNPAQWNPSGIQYHQGQFLFFEPEVLTQRLREAGFVIIRADLISDGEKSRAQTGVIAVKE